MTNRSSSGRTPSLSAIRALCTHNLLGVREERLFVKDLEGRFLLVNDGWLAALGNGLGLGDVLGKTEFDFFTRQRASAGLDDERRIIATGQPVVARLEREAITDRREAWVATTRWPLRDGDGRIVGTFGVSRDVTAQMQDPTTGLANRMALMDRLGHALVGLERQPGRLALLFLDVDGFKQVNDTLGHRAGDLVLGELAARLRRVSRRFDTVARYGGDEFVLLCMALRERENLGLIAERVRRTVAAPLSTAPSLRLSSSIGAVISCDPAADPVELLERGDLAMYAAKRDGGDRLVVYDADLHQPALDVR
jgi:diguanylate cyclase (GGDEF)-like protein/PAS domain S-box-containing protein